MQVKVNEPCHQTKKTTELQQILSVLGLKLNEMSLANTNIL